MEVRVFSWNLFHGRDFPPEPELRGTWGSRLLRRTERGPSHAQVNRGLFAEFSGLVAGADWDVALLQECPPRWAERLAIDAGADPHLALTSRNLPGLGWLQGRIADLNPDLIASWEGGSNLTLARTTGARRAAITERRELRLALRPERRVMAFTALASGLCVANLHASVERDAAEREVPEAAHTAINWAAGRPVILGGDFNLRPVTSPHVFEVLARHGFSAPTGPKSIDHLLVRGAEVAEPAREWKPEGRERPDPTGAGGTPLPIRLSDHPPVETLVRVG